MSARRRRWHHRTIAVIVVAVAAGTVVVLRTRTDVDHHPRLVAVAIPAEANWLEVFKSGEAVEIVTHLVVGHRRESPVRIHPIGRDAHRDPLDSAG